MTSLCGVRDLLQSTQFAGFRGNMRALFDQEISYRIQITDSCERSVVSYIYDI